MSRGSREVITLVTTRLSLSTAEPVPLSSGSEGDPEPPSLVKEESDLFLDSEGEETVVMAALHEDDPKIGSLNAHLNGEPSGAIMITPGQAGIEMKNNVLAVMPHFYGRRIDNPYEFLHEFCKLCGIQRRPAGSTEEDYRLRALPFALKTNALKKEIQGATQESDETLIQYWSRFKGMLEACPNNRMSEAEIYNNFYEGMTPESKDLVNSSSGGDFSRLRVSEAKRIISRLIDAKKAYDNPRTTILRGRSTKQPTPPEKSNAQPGPEEMYPYYGPPAEMEYPAQVNAAGSWNPGKQRDAPWRDHLNFRWSDANQSPPPQRPANFPQPPEGQSNWSSRN
ncbi:hypothetical protein AAHA92_10602 [Salvia divinorum]|uniref:Retrotransposon gag domain-containing protein n=1 Tax=Salvia divinorum TaxID=28513 RepID=A0ABD1HV79_SALDI